MNLLGKSLPPLASLLPFEAAARLGSFSRAADELHITQAAVSRQIRGLEEDLGVTLFDRRNRAVFLTPQGQQLGLVVSIALNQIGSVADNLRVASRRHQVVLLSQLCEAFYWLMPRLSRFHQRHPDIEIQVVTTTQPLTEFGGHFDVALQSTGRASGINHLLFTASDEVFPVCSPNYLNRHEEALKVTDLVHHTLLHHRATPPHLMEWDSWLAEFGIVLDGRTQSRYFDSYPMMLQAAVEGHGIAVGWARTAGRLVDSGALTRPCSESVFLPQAISIFKRPVIAERRETEHLIEWLRSELLEEIV
ncbi:LysR substrate-binding domain-containing protein [Pseudomonas sp. M30-35]|uniref:LysR substrate-binding domain-containing protein n=1 Tax=Pseudomonas sp. M30-35 TaxID=1981174 RepID=UPI000B3D0A78|nr:LysR substrate-binding domain-containing protein [Pseudomonas sp. M30-35]ARU90299.1 LysR family transcriptional regulator [Pseudomonas sp. M30-35]